MSICRQQFFLAFVICAVSGCAVHPLPEDVTGVPTYTIVRKIRCEARDAIKDNLIQWLKVVPGDPSANDIGIGLENGTIKLNNFNDSMFHSDVLDIIKKFEGSAIAYDFTFDMSVTNNLDASLDLIDLARRVTGSAGLGAGVDRTRENIRTFTIADTFIRLLRDVPDDYCGTLAVQEDYLYPITGTIGVDEMIHTFVELSLFANLSAKSGPPTIGDTITFTTKLSGSAAPKVVLTPVGQGFHLADASISAVATRTDIHKVIVALALPTPPQPAESKKPGLFVSVPAGSTPAENLAAQAIEQIILRFELGKPSVIVTTP